jgi:hypothetical protein
MAKLERANDRKHMTNPCYSRFSVAGTERKKHETAHQQPYDLPALHLTVPSGISASRASTV